MQYPSWPVEGAVCALLYCSELGSSSPPRYEQLSFHNLGRMTCPGLRCPAGPSTVTSFNLGDVTFCDDSSDIYTDKQQTNTSNLLSG